MKCCKFEGLIVGNSLLDKLVLNLDDDKKRHGFSWRRI
jgi:hypothetical protein